MRCLQLLTIFCHFEIYQYLLLTVGRHGRDHIAAGQWFFPSSLVSHIDKTGRHDITEILLDHDHDGPLLEVNIGIFQNDKI
jgi:hypothetical protein